MNDDLRIDRLDLAALAICGGLAWHFDMPGVLIGGGFAVLISPLMSGLGRRAGARVADRLDRPD
jgi:hypothetical protein